MYFFLQGFTRVVLLVFSFFIWLVVMQIKDACESTCFHIERRFFFQYLIDLRKVPVLALVAVVVVDTAEKL